MKPGFYLFQPTGEADFTCTVEAALRAEDDIRNAFPDPQEPAHREAADELFARRQAHYMREASCRTTNYRELSSDEALSIELRNEAFPTFDPHDSGSGPESAAAARSLLSRLPSPFAEVAVYYYLDELSQREIANILKCSQLRAAFAIRSALAVGKYF